MPKPFVMLENGKTTLLTTRQDCRNEGAYGDNSSFLANTTDHQETMRLRPTPRTDAAANESIVKVYETSKQLERELAAAREEGEEQARLLGMSAEREAGLLAKIERLERQLAKLSETP
jgi:septal ring factor EnvC (AmiA/AmiB activator)